jgi:hypothetical protein
VLCCASQLALPQPEAFQNWTWRKLSKRQMGAATMHWCDVDGVAKDEALTMLRQFQPRPTIILFSGSGLWGFWRLWDGELFDDGDEPWLDFEARNRWLARSVKGGDSCHNAERIGRMPGTWNWPSPRKIKNGRTRPELVYVLDVHGFACSADNFERVYDDRSRPQVASTQATRSTSTWTRCPPVTTWTPRSISTT